MVVVAGPGAFLFIIEFLLFSYLYKYISIFAPSYFLIPFFLFTIWVLFLALGDDENKKVQIWIYIYKDRKTTKTRL